MQILLWALAVLLSATIACAAEISSDIRAPDSTGSIASTARTKQITPGEGSFQLARSQTEEGLPAPDLNSMIGQMILIGFPGSKLDGEWTQRALGMIHEGRIGGVVLFADNITDPVQLKAMTDALERANPEFRPFICIDQEGGTIQRLTKAKGFVGLPSAAHVATLDRDQAARLFRRTARELAELGVNVNFGPVVDLNIDPQSAAIGRLGRSFGRDPQTVIAYAQQFVDEHRREGVLTVAKHFPGHGSAHDDPHDQVIDVTKSWKKVELTPFRDLVNVDMVMVGHLVHPRYSDGDRPASLSVRAIQDLLRGELGFNGLVVTDDLDMGAIRKRYGVPAAAVMAIAAGADLLIVANHKPPRPKIVEEITRAVVEAVGNGEIQPEAIRDSYRRILAAKQKLVDRRAYVMH